VIKQLLNNLSVSSAAIGKYADALDAAIELHHINNKNGFLAQVLFESNMLLSIEENLRYKTEKALVASYGKRAVGRVDLLNNPEVLANWAYAGRNGNTQPGDGWRYRGRGFLQLTGRGNYKKYGYEEHPDDVSTPTGAAMSAAEYWIDNGIDTLTDINMCTRRINGPAMKDADKRKELYERICKWTGKA